MCCAPIRNLPAIFHHCYPMVVREWETWRAISLAPFGILGPLAFHRFILRGYFTTFEVDPGYGTVA